MAQLIFIIALPRSGSTLLQRILAGHKDICTVAEPWFLLPLIYMTRKKCVYAEFSWNSLTNAMQDVISCLPNGEVDYYEAIKSYSDTIYTKLNVDNAKYFLDKTPRYYFIIDELYKLYPDAKYVFLFRHPLSIYSSVINSFNNGNLGNVRHRIDIEEGPKLLANGFKSLQDKSFALNFEELVAQPEKQLRALCEFFDIEYSTSMTDLSKSVSLSGQMGDSIGTKLYSNINSEASEKWRSTFSTPYRKRVAKKYLQSIGRDNIEIMGYDYDGIMNDIDKLKVRKRKFIIDIYNQTRCSLLSAIEIFIAKDKLKKRVSRNSSAHLKMYPHS